MKYLINNLFLSKNPPTPIFSNIHLLILVLCFSILIFILKKRSLFNNQKNRKFFKNILISAIVVQQLLLYGWYFFTNNFNVIDALPLYPCRLCSIGCLVMLIKPNKNLLDLLFYWGLTGATLALIVPDTSGLGFPNAMFIQFYLGHFLILISVLFLTITEQYTPSIQGLKNCYKKSLIYFGLIIIFNHFNHSNYGYLNQKPGASFLNFIPNYPYHIPILILFMFFLFFIVYMISSTLKKQTQLNTNKIIT